MALRLLFSAAFDTSRLVGITRYIRQLTPELARLCDLTILSPDPDTFSGICGSVRLPQIVRRRDARVLWSIACLRDYCKVDYDVLLCATPIAPIGVRLPKIVVAHDITPLAMRHLHGSREKAAFLLGLQSLRLADWVIADSSSTKAELVRTMRHLRPSRFSVAYPGPGLLPVPGIESAFAHRLRPFVLYVGGHARHKNLDRLLSAFARLREQDHLRLVIVGAYDARLQKRTLEQARFLGLANRVALLDSLSDNQLSSLYQECAVFVYPSLYEGFGLPVLEAMAHAAPVACSRATSIPEIGGDAVEYFDPSSDDDILRKLKLLLDDRDHARELASRALARSRQFTWARTARTVFDCAVSLAAARSRSHRALPAERR